MLRKQYQIEIIHIRYFLQVSLSGSFRKAADVLEVRESTVSRRMRDLETRLGVRLLMRNHSGTNLTAAGCRFLVAAQDVINRFDATLQFANVKPTVSTESNLCGLSDALLKMRDVLGLSAWQILTIITAGLNEEHSSGKPMPATSNH